MFPVQTLFVSGKKKVRKKKVNEKSAMEEEQQASKPLPIDSFSYSWLVNFPSLENLELNSRRTSVDTCDDSSSFIEMDPRLPPSRRFLISPKESFKFDFSVSDSLVHADELFCNGYVMPLFADVRSNAAEESEQLDSGPAKPEIRIAGLTKSKSCRRFRRLSKWVLLKYLDFLTPLCRRIRGRKAAGSGSGNGTMSIDTRIRVTTRNRVYSDETSPRISAADDWRRSCDSESSIYEAVLHCKKSFGK